MKIVLTTMTLLSFLMVSPVFADQHCTCSEVCQKQCKAGDTKNCDCKTCQCKEGKCSHEKCSDK